MRLRVFPLVLFIGTALFTLRIGNMWQEATLTAGRPSEAQTSASQPAAPAAAPLPPVTPSGPAQQTLLGQPQPAADTAATGTATGIAAGGRQSAAALADNPFNYTDNEIELLQSLAKRRDELDRRAAALDQREALLAAAEQRMDQKLAELKAIQQQIQSTVTQQQQAQDAQYKSLVKTYEVMKPKDAAVIFDTLDLDVLLELAGRMKEAKLAPVLAAMDPAKAQQVTVELAARKAPTVR